MDDKDRIDRAEVPAAYAMVAQSDAGKIMLADLERRFNHDEVFDQDPLIMAGRAREQGVVRHIQKLIKKGKSL